MCGLSLVDQESTGAAGFLWWGRVFTAGAGFLWLGGVFTARAQASGWVGSSLLRAGFLWW